MNITPDLVVIGSSTGGPKALLELFTHTVTPCPFPIVIVNHFPKGDFTTTFCRELTSKTKTIIKEAEHQEIIQDGMVYLCPGGQHLTLKKVPRGLKVIIDNDPHIDGCKPSIDKFFNSVSNCDIKRGLTIVLSGMGHDGLEGSKSLKEKRFKVVTQNEKSCMIYGMPHAIDHAGITDETYDTKGISRLLNSFPKSKIQQLKSERTIKEELEKKVKIARPITPKKEVLPVTSKLSEAKHSLKAPEELILTDVNKEILLNFIQSKTGNNTYSKDKDYLLIEKISALASAYECETFLDLLRKLKTDKEALDDLISSMTIHESFFFRDHYPYRYLSQELIPSWTKDHRTVNIWTSACANGQELYSIMFTIHDYFEENPNSKLSPTQIRVYASDIAKSSVEFSKSGIYNKSMIRRGLRTEQIKKFFDIDNSEVIVKPTYNRNVKFLQLNLLEPLHVLPKMHCIFCRYTLIYFDETDQKKAIDALANKLMPKGILILDPAISLRVESDLLEKITFERFVLFRRK